MPWEAWTSIIVVVSGDDLRRAMVQYAEWLDNELQSVDHAVDQPAAADA